MKNEVKQAGMKRSTKCKKLKDKGEFGKEKRVKNGLRCWCKQCEQQYQRVYYLRTRKAKRRYFKYEDSHRVVGGVKQKLCRKCRKWKAESEFHRKPRHQGWIKSKVQEMCQKVSQAAAVGCEELN